MPESQNLADEVGSWLNLTNSAETQDPFGSPWVLHFAYGPVDDYVDQVHIDPQYLTKLAPKRAREFSTGRYLAAKALLANGANDTQVPRQADRSPLWPAGFLGSISHSNRLALVATSKVGLLHGLGIDIEECGRLGENLFDSVFTQWEQTHYAQGNLSGWPDLVFSAKEAIYKAVNPKVGKFIGFHEVEVEFTSRDRFNVRYVGDHQPNTIMHRGMGFAATRESHVMTLFGLAAANPAEADPSC